MFNNVFINPIHISLVIFTKYTIVICREGFFTSWKFFILVLIYFSVCRNSGVGSGIRRVFSYIADQCSEIKDYYTPEALNLEIQRQSLGVFTLERESQQFANYNPDPDTVTMISMDSEPGVVTHRSGFSDVPLN